MKSYTQHIKKNRSKKNMMLFSSGLFVSLLGTQMFNFAVGLYVLTLTGSGLSFATTLVIGSLPRFIAAPFLGVVVDRFDRKRLIYMSDFICGILVLSMLLMSRNGEFKLAIIYFITFCLGIVNTLFDIAASASKPNLVEDKELLQINALSQGITSTAMIMGPLLGGLVYATLDFKFFVLINGCSFIISGVSECFLEFDTHLKTKTKEESKYLKDIQEGLQYLINHKGLSRILGISVAINFFIHFAVIIPLPYVLNIVYKVSAKQYGFVNSTFSIGMILMTMILFKMKNQSKIIKTIPYAVLTYGVFILMMALPVWNSTLLWEPTLTVVFYSLVMFVFGITIAILDIPFMAYAQRSVEENMRGRVFSTFLSISKIASPIALLLSGYLIEFVSIKTLCTSSGILLMVLLLKLGVMNLGSVMQESEEQVSEAIL